MTKLNLPKPTIFNEDGTNIQAVKLGTPNTLVDFNDENWFKEEMEGTAFAEGMQAQLIIDGNVALPKAHNEATVRSVLSAQYQAMIQHSHPSIPYIEGAFYAENSFVHDANGDIFRAKIDNEDLLSETDSWENTGRNLETLMHVEDSLTSSNTTTPLSANQGKLINDRLDANDTAFTTGTLRTNIISSDGNSLLIQRNNSTRITLNVSSTDFLSTPPRYGNNPSNSNDLCRKAYVDAKSGNLGYVYATASSTSSGDLSWTQILSNGLTGHTGTSWTAPSTGIYLFEGHGTIIRSGTNVTASIYKNGAIEKTILRLAATGGGVNDVDLTASWFVIISLTIGDIITWDASSWLVNATNKQAFSKITKLT